MSDLARERKESIEQSRTCELAALQAQENQKISGHLKASIEADVDFLLEARESAKKILSAVDLKGMERESNRFVDDGIATALGSLKQHIHVLTPGGDERSEEWRKKSQTLLCAEVSGFRTGVASTGIHGADAVGFLYVLGFSSCHRESYAKHIGEHLLHELKASDLVWFCCQNYLRTRSQSTCCTEQLSTMSSRIKIASS